MRFGSWRWPTAARSWSVAWSRPTTRTYRILDPGPLPVSDYEATIAVREGESSVIDWRATFTPAGAFEADAVEAIAGVFEGGLDAL